MKTMHKPEITARVKIEEYLEKDNKELIDLAYASAKENDRRFLIGIAYKRCHDKDNPSNSDRYDVIIYDIKTDLFVYSSTCLNYENALIEVGQRIRRETYSTTL